MHVSQVTAGPCYPTLIYFPAQSGSTLCQLSLLLPCEPPTMCTSISLFNLPVTLFHPDCRSPTLSLYTCQPLPELTGQGAAHLQWGRTHPGTRQRLKVACDYVLAFLGTVLVVRRSLHSAADALQGGSSSRLKLCYCPAVTMNPFMLSLIHSTDACWKDLSLFSSNPHTVKCSPWKLRKVIFKRVGQKFQKSGLWAENQ